MPDLCRKHYHQASRPSPHGDDGALTILRRRTRVDYVLTALILANSPESKSPRKHQCFQGLSVVAGARNHRDRHDRSPGLISRNHLKQRKIFLRDSLLLAEFPEPHRERPCRSSAAYSTACHRTAAISTRPWPHAGRRGRGAPSPLGPRPRSLRNITGCASSWMHGIDRADTAGETVTRRSATCPRIGPRGRRRIGPRPRAVIRGRPSSPRLHPGVEVLDQIAHPAAELEEHRPVARHPVLSPTLFDAGFPRLFDVNPARIFLIVRSFPDRCVGAHGLCARFRLAVRLRFGLVLEES